MLTSVALLGLSLALMSSRVIDWAISLTTSMTAAGLLMHARWRRR
jgi:hypothetical protein